MKILNKRLQNINHMSKNRIAPLAGYAQNILETKIKLRHIYKYFHSIMNKNIYVMNHLYFIKHLYL